MTPQEKIEDINYFWHINTGIIPSREAAICYAQNDIEWLLNRVKTLEAAVVYVIKDLDTIGVTKSEIAQLEVCRKALVDES